MLTAIVADGCTNNDDDVDDVDDDSNADDDDDDDDDDYPSLSRPSVGNVNINVSVWLWRYLKDSLLTYNQYYDRLMTQFTAQSHVCVLRKLVEME